nr:hypothetical protein [Tanacetum cinerariifolium]
MTRCGRYFSCTPGSGFSCRKHPLRRPWRARRQLPPALLPDPGQPGAQKRALQQGQPVDVPRRAPGRAPHPHPQSAAPALRGHTFLPGIARAHGRAHGPDAQRLVRYFLPGHGLPRGRAGRQPIHRPRGIRARQGHPAAAARLRARHRRAGAAPDQHRPEHDQGRN